MKLTELIDHLKDILEFNGDLNVVYSCDEEGNNFEEVFYAPSVGFYSENEFSDEEDEINAVCIN